MDPFAMDVNPEEYEELFIDRVDVGAALNFLKKFYPGFWDRVEEQDIVSILEIAQLLFKARPDLIEATNNTRYKPLQ